MKFKCVRKNIHKVSNVHGEVHFKQKQREIHSLTENSPVKGQKFHC